MRKLHLYSITKIIKQALNSMFPASRLGDETVTKDTIIAPGMPNVLIGGQPASCLGDAVVGQFIVGVVVTGCFTVLVGGRPLTRTTSQVAGILVNAPPTPGTTIVRPGCFTVLVGS